MNKIFALELLHGQPFSKILFSKCLGEALKHILHFENNIFEKLTM